MLHRPIESARGTQTTRAAAQGTASGQERSLHDGFADGEKVTKNVEEAFGFLEMRDVRTLLEHMCFGARDAAM